MDILDAQITVEEIKRIADDDERAHSLEDSFRNNFIQHVAERKDKIGKVARIVLSTNDIDFARWCA